MAAGDITVYDKFLLADKDQSTLSGMPVDFDTNVIKVVILKNTFTPDTTPTSTQEHFDNISTLEVATGTSYTGPITLASVTLTLTAGNVKFDAADISLSADAGGGFTDGRYIVFYKDTGAAATSPLIAVGDLGSDQDLAAADLIFTWAATGILAWSKA